jgi:hypothetical protein
MKVDVALSISSDMLLLAVLCFVVRLIIDALRCDDDIFKICRFFVHHFPELACVRVRSSSRASKRTGGKKLENQGYIF